jgi:hypothetical protein
MPRGGARPGAGRPKGSQISKTRETAEKLLADGFTPLEYMTGVMRGDVEYDEIKFEAAKAAAPYMHARLAAVEAKVAMTVEDLDEAALNREIAQAAAAAGLISH